MQDNRNTSRRELVGISGVRRDMEDSREVDTLSRVGFYRLKEHHDGVHPPFKRS